MIRRHDSLDDSILHNTLFVLPFFFGTVDTFQFSFPVETSERCQELMVSM